MMSIGTDLDAKVLIYMGRMILHCIGNMIGSVLSIVDAVVNLLMLGYPLMPKYKLSFKWTMYKLKSRTCLYYPNAQE